MRSRVTLPALSRLISFTPKVRNDRAPDPAVILVPTPFSTMTNWNNTQSRPQAASYVRATWLLFAAIFAAVYFGSLFSPPLLDDVDAAHAQAAQHVAETGNWITCEIDGIRYIEKPPLPYWLVAGSYRIFGENTFATHLPNALAMLGLTWLSWAWARRAWGLRGGLYAGLGVLTSIGPFLFTRFIIPEAILSLFLLIALYGLITGLETSRPIRIYWMWASVALALLTKGLIAPVFFAGAAIPYLLLTGQWRRWRQLKPVTGFLLFLAIAAPWHILCGLANPDQGHPVGNHPTIGNVHGFFLLLFRQRTLPALLLLALPARLQQAALRRLLAAAPCVALPVEPVSSRPGGRGLEDSPSLGSARPPRCRPDIGFLPR